MGKKDDLVEFLRAKLADGTVPTIPQMAKAAGMTIGSTRTALVELKRDGVIDYPRGDYTRITMKGSSAAKRAPAQKRGGKAPKRGAPKRGGPKRAATRRRATPQHPATVPPIADDARLIVAFSGLKRIQAAAHAVGRAASELADAVGVVIGDAQAVGPLLAPLAQLVEQLGTVVPRPVSVLAPTTAPKTARARARRTVSPKPAQPSADDEEEPVAEQWERGEPAPLPASKIEVKIDVRDQDPDRVIRRLFDQIGTAAARPGLGEREIDGETFTVENEKGELLLGARTLGKVLGHHLATPERTRVVFHRRRDGKATDVFLTPWVPA